MKSKTWDSFKGKLLDQDAYSRSLNNLLPNGSDSFPSWHGVVITFIIYSMLVVQLISKLNTLMVYGDTSIIESIEVDHFDSEYRFTNDEGLNFAFGMVSLNED